MRSKQTYCRVTRVAVGYQKKFRVFLMVGHDCQVRSNFEFPQSLETTFRSLGCLLRPLCPLCHDLRRTASRSTEPPRSPTNRTLPTPTIPQHVWALRARRYTRWFSRFSFTFTPFWGQLRCLMLTLLILFERYHVYPWSFA
jgi:hypothetical protein